MVPCSVQQGNKTCLVTDQVFSQRRADVKFEIKRTLSSQMIMWHWMQVEEPESSVTTLLK